jgi:RimJ/RimL family protein N-acetyltransferase
LAFIKSRGIDVLLRRLQTEDIQTVKLWPAYPPEFKDLDYALRERGWLTEYSKKPEAHIWMAVEAGQDIGFALLCPLQKGEAEFRIALRADKLGQGFGKQLTLLVLAEGFQNLNYANISLIVRQANLPALNLYRSVGFELTGECRKVIQGQVADFFCMRLSNPNPGRAA